jgi:molybdopterin-biosynthesis enzyme MoeA-like protein
MAIGLIVIGTELLTGKRRDSHFAHTVETLANRGLALSWCRYIGDCPQAIVGVRGHAGNVDDAVAWLTEALDGGGWRWQKRAPSTAA